MMPASNISKSSAGEWGRQVREVRHRRKHHRVTGRTAYAATTVGITYTRSLGCLCEEHHFTQDLVLRHVPNGFTRALFRKADSARDLPSLTKRHGAPFVRFDDCSNEDLLLERPTGGDR